MVSLDVTIIIRYELKTMHATKTGKGAFSEICIFQQVYFFRIRSIVESAILATRNLVLIG